ncbi:hypothetical protein KEM55_002741 [Ascosphaera atra]|nr:hypothetical protein KEM55_002741 [Ascosphaera atra]
MPHGATPRTTHRRGARRHVSGGKGADGGNTRGSRGGDGSNGAGRETQDTPADAAADLVPGVVRVAGAGVPPGEAAKK